MTFRRCANCYGTIAPRRRKCVACKASVRFARPETPEEAAAREAKDAAMEALIQELTGC
jgi:hypothetical protein